MRRVSTRPGASSRAGQATMPLTAAPLTAAPLTAAPAAPTARPGRPLTTPEVTSLARCCSPCSALETMMAPVSAGITHCNALSCFWALATSAGVLGSGAVPSTPAEVAKAQKQLKALQWVIPALTGGIIVSSALQGEQQRASEVTSGVVKGLPGRAVGAAGAAVKGAAVKGAAVKGMVA